jgi:hypothetical protein
MAGNLAHSGFSKLGGISGKRCFPELERKLISRRVAPTLEETRTFHSLFSQRLGAGFVADRMKSYRAVLLILALMVPYAVRASDGEWQDGRIADVQPDENSKVLYWIANTPVTKDDVNFRISVHVKEKLFIGSYAPSRSQGPPPKEWVKNRPVKVQIEGDTMVLRTPAGDELKLNIIKRKSALPMKPITAAEWESQAGKPAAAPESLVGFSKPAPESPAALATSKSNATGATQSTGSEQTSSTSEVPATVSISSTPYLADVYVDGKLEGYTPAKISVAPGKHSIRLEKQGYKNWSKDITVEPGSESTVDATLSVGKR